jgi:hypothetical protein
MELKDMTFPQVLQLKLFRDQLEVQMDIEQKALNNAGRLQNRVVLQSLIKRGLFTAEDLTTAYYHIMHKEMTGYSSRERQYITDVCTLAYTRTIRQLQQESDENDRNPLLHFVRWLLAKFHVKKDIV